MGRGQDEISEQSEARRHYSSHDEDDASDHDASSEDGGSRGRSEGLDTLKSYLREIRRSTLLTFKQEQQLGKRVMAGDEQTRQQMT
jgi:RNA polymerase primary sigma factor/RNA polymerase nonessential primary-like sigma factor